MIRVTGTVVKCFVVICNIKMFVCIIEVDGRISLMIEIFAIKNEHMSKYACQNCNHGVLWGGVEG